MDFDRLSRGERIVGISGLLLVAFSFIDWLGLRASSTAQQFGVPLSAEDWKSAWSFPVTTLAVVIGLVMVALVTLKLLGANLRDPGPFAWGQVMFAMGSAALLLIVVKLAVGPAEWSFKGSESLDLDVVERLCRGLGNCDEFSVVRGVGIILGCISALGLAIGGYLCNQEDTKAHASPPKERSRVSA